jgi:hypothetical protein
VGAWSPSLDGDLEPLIEMKRVSLIYTNEACVLLGTQLGILIHESVEVVPNSLQDIGQLLTERS